MNPGASGLARGLRVLEVLAGEEAAAAGGLGVVRVAELVSAEKSQASRTLTALAERGFVERDPVTQTYRLGWQAFALAAQAGEPRLLVAAPVVLRRLVAELGESAHLSVRHGASVTTVLSESPPSALHAPGRVGVPTPVRTTATGRALVVDLSPGELEDLGLGDIAERVAAIRAEGHAAVVDEFEPGLAAVAAPVRDFSGSVVAAVNVSGPTFRLSPRLDKAATSVRAAAAELSGALGFSGRSVA